MTIVYATTDETCYQQRKCSATVLQTDSEVTAAADVPESESEAVSDKATHKQYAVEAERVAEQYDPDDSL